MYSDEQLEAAFNAGCAYTVGSHKDLKQIHPNFQAWNAKLKKKTELKNRIPNNTE